MRNKWVKICWNKGSILHTIICIYVLYKLFTQIVYIMFMMCALSRSQLMYTKRIQSFYIQNVSHIWTNFCIQNVYKLFVYKMYTTFWQTFVYILHTKFGWCSSFDFAYKMYTRVRWNMAYILYTFCIHFVYIGCIHLLQFVYTKCIHSFRVGICRLYKARDIV